MLKQPQRIKGVNIKINDFETGIPLSQKGQPNGVATLDGSGKVPLAQIPTIPIIAAGSNGQLQFNNAGGLGADATLSWNNTNKRLSVGTNSAASGLTLNGTDALLTLANSASTWQFMFSGSELFLRPNANQAFHIQIAAGTSQFISQQGRVRILADTLFNTADASPTARVDIRGRDTNNNAFALAVHNSTGNNNALMVRNDGNVGIGTNAPTSSLHIRNSGAIPQLRIDNGVNGGNGAGGSIQFTDTNTSFIAMNRTGGTSCIISIPPNNNSQDLSHLHIQYNNTGTGFYIFPRRSHDSIGNRTVLKTDGDANNGNQSRGIDFINGSSGNALSYTLPAFRFYSSYKTAIDSYGLRLQINNVTQARATANENIAEIWGVNSLVGYTDGNSITINNSALLQLDSTTRGFLPPRMTTAQFNTIGSKASGLMAYSNDDNGLLFWDGTRITGFRYNGTKFQGYDGTTWNDLN